MEIMFMKRNVKKTHKWWIEYEDGSRSLDLEMSQSAYTLGFSNEKIINAMADQLRTVSRVIPYWQEELIYDFQTKKRIRYHEMVNQIEPISELAQIFTLNKNLFVQIENDVKMFGNKNLNDADRLFEILKQDLLKKKKTNFMFVKDITTYQRKQLYKLLESKGFNRRELFRHYSY